MKLLRIRRHLKPKFQLLHLLAVGLFCFWSFNCFSVVGVNYLDPNLSDRKDEVSRASLNCASLHGLDNEFKRCLNRNGVTDPSEQDDALDQARNTANDVSP